MIAALLLVALPLLGALAALALGHRSVLAAVLVAATSTALGAWLAFSQGAPSGHLWGGYFTVDPTSRLFLLVINLIFLGVVGHVRGRMQQAPELLDGIERFIALALTFLAAANLSVLSNHLLLGWLALEATSLAAAPLVARRATATAVRAAWGYFLFSSVGLGITSLGFACLARSLEHSGAEPVFFFDQLRTLASTPPDAWREVGLALVIVGYGTKLGLAPMYSWLPDAYEEAPPSVTAMLAGVQFNCALVGLLRVLQVYRDGEPRMVSVALLGIGLASMAVSTFSVIATHNYKRLLAYASINHGGVIAIGLGPRRAGRLRAGALRGQQRLHQGDPLPLGGQDRRPLRHPRHARGLRAHQGPPGERALPHRGHLRAAGLSPLRQLPRRAAHPLGADAGRLRDRLRGLLRAAHGDLRGHRPIDLPDDLGRVEEARPSPGAAHVPDQAGLRRRPRHHGGLPAAPGELPLRRRRGLPRRRPMKRSFPLRRWAVSELDERRGERWAERVRARLDEGLRVVSAFARNEGSDVIATALLQSESGELELVRGRLDRAHGYHSLTPEHPAMHCFEREMHEQTGLRIGAHPWLKPLRYEGVAASSAMGAHPFYKIQGKEVHEVQVGPVHAGVIEPGAFRFMCLGERVHHLEIQLGYQHRGVEGLLLKGDARSKAQLVETIAGDSSIAHGLAYASAIEALSGLDADAALERGRSGRAVESRAP
ncbi:MAG: hypothetical protein IPN17_08945 [Deltaproteobacteria bacterium]|nr:hypothetical protein [Deltaproteobacteria bacterium]